MWSFVTTVNFAKNVTVSSVSFTKWEVTNVKLFYKIKRDRRTEHVFEKNINRVLVFRLSRKCTPSKRRLIKIHIICCRGKANSHKINLCHSKIVENPEITF